MKEKWSGDASPCPNRKPAGARRADRGRIETEESRDRAANRQGVGVCARSRTRASESTIDAARVPACAAAGVSQAGRLFQRPPWVRSDATLGCPTATPRCDTPSAGRTVPAAPYRLLPARGGMVFAKQLVAPNLHAYSIPCSLDFPGRGRWSAKGCFRLTMCSRAAAWPPAAFSARRCRARFAHQLPAVSLLTTCA